jgi:tRNA dimethylallyltransferase
MSELNKNFRTMNNDYILTYIALNMDRTKLYERINHRVDIMMENGLIEEVESILRMGYNKDLTALKAIGYKEIISYLENEVTLEESVELIKKGSRNYAKRQLTWFRRDERIKWIDVDIYDNILDVSEVIRELIIGNTKY